MISWLVHVFVEITSCYLYFQSSWLFEILLKNFEETGQSPIVLDRTKRAQKILVYQEFEKRFHFISLPSYLHYIIVDNFLNLKSLEHQLLKENKIVKLRKEAWFRQRGKFFGFLLVYFVFYSIGPFLGKTFAVFQGHKSLYSRLRLLNNLSCHQSRPKEIFVALIITLRTDD